MTTDQTLEQELTDLAIATEYLWGTLLDITTEKVSFIKYFKPKKIPVNSLPFMPTKDRETLAREILPSLVKEAEEYIRMLSEALERISALMDDPHDYTD